MKKQMEDRFFQLSPSYNNTNAISKYVIKILFQHKLVCSNLDVGNIVCT